MIGASVCMTGHLAAKLFLTEPINAETVVLTGVAYLAGMGLLGSSGLVCQLKELRRERRSPSWHWSAGSGTRSGSRWISRKPEPWHRFVIHPTARGMRIYLKTGNNTGIEMISRTIVPLETAEPKVSLSFAALTGALRRAAQGHWEGITRGYGAVTFTAAEKAINWTSVGFGLPWAARLARLPAGIRMPL